MTESSTHIAPSFAAVSFNCPHCEVLAQQSWIGLRGKPIKFIEGTRRIIGQNIPEFEFDIQGWYFAQCMACSNVSVWNGDAMVFPSVFTAPPPNTDLPEDIKKDYEEARAIVRQSPRGAAALLRLCVQKLCKEVGEKGKNINEDIASLVRKGLTPAVQQALDSVRVIGNEAVHPGQIDFSDSPKIAQVLFQLVNFICHKMITEPRQIEGIYQALPSQKLAEIERRDREKESQ